MGWNRRGSAAQRDGVGATEPLCEVQRAVRWSNSKPGPIGIELGAHQLRAAQVVRSARSLEIVAAASVVTPGALDFGDPEALATLASPLRELLQRGRFSGRRAVLGLPLRAARIKNFRLPCMPDEELAAAVRFEARERFAGLDDEAQVRFYNAGAVASGQGEQAELIVLAVPGPVIRAHLALLAQLRLRAEALELPPGAMFRCFERFLQRNEDAGVVNAFFDLGESGSRLVIAQGREIAFLKTFDIGAAHLRAAVAKSFTLNDTEAAELWHSVSHGVPEADPADEAEPATPGAGQPADDETDEVSATDATCVADATSAESIDRLPAVREAIAPLAAQLGKELNLCLRYFSVTFRGYRPDSITAVGGLARHGLWLTALSEAAGLPVRQGHPLRHVQADRVFAGDDRRSGQPEWATALGLAMYEPAAATVAAPELVSA